MFAKKFGDFCTTNYRAASVIYLVFFSFGAILAGRLAGFGLSDLESLFPVVRTFGRLLVLKERIIKCYGV